MLENCTGWVVAKLWQACGSPTDNLKAHPAHAAPALGRSRARAGHLPSGTLIYLDASPSLDAALARTLAAGGQVALARQALPPGMGFFAHITELDGNRVGLHALV